MRARWTVVGALAVFWAGTAVAGALAPGYSARGDFVSSLAGRGSDSVTVKVAVRLARSI